MSMPDENNLRPPHMNPMSTTEVRALLTSTMHGALPHATMQRIFATLSEWLPIVDQKVTRGVTPPEEAPTWRTDHLTEMVLERFDVFMDNPDFAGVEALEVMQALADRHRPYHAAVEELFGGCKTTTELAELLFVVLNNAPNVNREIILKLHTKTCELNGWESA